MSVSLPSDTSPLVEKLLIEGYRCMSAAEKVARVTELTRTVQQFALADIRRRHPNATAREQSLRLASRWLEPELMRRAFDWDPERAGF